MLQSDGSWEEYVRTWTAPGAVVVALNNYRTTYHIDLAMYRDEAKLVSV